MNSTNGHINEYKSSDDSALVKGIALGGLEAMEALMDRYLPMVSRLTYRVLCDKKASETATEEVFITKEIWEIYCRASHFLTARQRIIFVLHDLEEIPISDIISIMHMRSDRIRHNLLIARDKIKEELRAYIRYLRKVTGEQVDINKIRREVMEKISFLHKFAAEK